MTDDFAIILPFNIAITTMITLKKVIPKLNNKIQIVANDSNLSIRKKKK